MPAFCLENKQTATINGGTSNNSLGCNKKYERGVIFSVTVARKDSTFEGSRIWRSTLLTVSNEPFLELSITLAHIEGVLPSTKRYGIINKLDYILFNDKSS